MHGDHSRITFEKAKQYSRVLAQQGRVYLEADINEQTAIFTHAIRALTRDLLGPHGTPSTAGPPDMNGFHISKETTAGHGFVIGLGAYYVDGIRCENIKEDAAYFDQPHFFADDQLPAGQSLVYLDVWERQLTYLDDPLIRETALGGPDTSTRAQIVWQVKVLEMAGALNNPPSPEEIFTNVQGRKPSELPRMRARVKPGEVSTTPCVMPPSSGYRGRENQLYRVEVHEAGKDGTATFKWSRDNGSVVFPVIEIGADSVTVDHLGLDATRSLVEGDWVELLDDIAVLHAGHGRLARVKGVPDGRVVELVPAVAGPLTDSANTDRHPFLRRWDHRGARPLAGAVTITESNDTDDGWLDIEDGIQVQFAVTGTNYVSGDYWTIVARTGTGKIEWPSVPVMGPVFREPSGVEHHYAPLAKVDGATITGFRNLITTTIVQEP